MIGFLRFCTSCIQEVELESSPTKNSTLRLGHLLRLRPGANNKRILVKRVFFLRFVSLRIRWGFVVVVVVVVVVVDVAVSLRPQTQSLISKNHPRGASPKTCWNIAKNMPGNAKLPSCVPGSHHPGRFADRLGKPKKNHPYQNGRSIGSALDLKPFRFHIECVYHGPQKTYNFWGFLR